MKRLLLVLCVPVLALGALALGQEASSKLGPGDFLIKAKAQERNGSVVRLHGDVIIETESVILHADNADFDMESREIRPIGNVSLKLK